MDCAIPSEEALNTSARYSLLQPAHSLRLAATLPQFASDPNPPLLAQTAWPDFQPLSPLRTLDAYEVLRGIHAIGKETQIPDA